MPVPLEYRNPKTNDERPKRSRFVTGLIVIFKPALIGAAAGEFFAVVWLLLLGGWGIPELFTFGCLFGGIGLFVGLLRANVYFGDPGPQ